MKFCFKYLIFVLLNMSVQLTFAQKEIKVQPILFHSAGGKLKDTYISILSNFTYKRDDTLFKFKVIDIQSLNNKKAVEDLLNKMITNAKNDINFENQDVDTNYLRYLTGFNYILELTSSEAMNKIMEFNLEVFITKTGRGKNDFPFISKEYSNSKTIFFSENDLTNELLSKKITAAYNSLFNPSESNIRFNILADRPTNIRNDTIFVQKFDTVILFTRFINERALNYLNYTSEFLIFDDKRSDNFFINKDVKIIGSNIDKVTLFFNKNGEYSLQQKVYNKISNEVIDRYYVLIVQEPRKLFNDVKYVYSAETGMLNRLEKKNRKPQNIVLSFYNKSKSNLQTLKISSEGKIGQSFFYKTFDSSNIVFLKKETKEDRFFAYYADSIPFTVTKDSTTSFYTVPSNKFTDENIDISNTILYEDLYTIQRIQIHKYASQLYLKAAFETFGLYFSGPSNPGQTSKPDNIGKKLVVYKLGLGINVFNKFAIEGMTNIFRGSSTAIDSTLFKPFGSSYSYGLTYRLGFGAFSSSGYPKSTFLYISAGIDNLSLSTNRKTNIKISQWYELVGLETPVLYSLIKYPLFFSVGIRISQNLQKDIQLPFTKYQIGDGFSSPGFSLGLRWPMTVE